MPGIMLYVHRLTSCRADAHPYALNHCVMLMVVSVIQARLASGGGWARLTPTVMQPQWSREKQDDEASNSSYDSGFLAGRL